MRAVTTGPSTGGEAIAPGRQDEFPRNRNPGFRSANLIICGTAHFSPMWLLSTRLTSWRSCALFAVACRVEPVVTRPAPPQSRT